MTAGVDTGARPASAGRAPGAPPGEGAEELLRLRGVVKNFGPVRALNAVDLTVPAGQVTALVGDNGAGKSTLIKTISGIWPLDEGEMRWNGKPVHLHSPRDATDLGIATVYQDLALCDNLDIVANMFLGREPLSGVLLDESHMELQAKATLTDLHVTTVRSIRQPVGSLSGGQRQAVAVAKAVMQNAQLVIMDEPTAALGVSQTEMVLGLIERLSSRGIAVLVISHNLSDVFRVADRLAVLYLGRLVSEGPIADYDTQRAVELITTGMTTSAADGRRAAPDASAGPGDGRRAALEIPAGGRAAAPAGDRAAPAGDRADPAPAPTGDTDDEGEH
ncbi:MAG TPA: ATP-binding cassette domain-containing protein [Acidimicrobiales bacterium]|nr:ATP-binding cassette domain-containing protein [Acidimicrobiales bacterium]